MPSYHLTLGLGMSFIFYSVLVLASSTWCLRILRPRKQQTRILVVFSMKHLGLYMHQCLLQMISTSSLSFQDSCHTVQSVLVDSLLDQIEVQQDPVIYEVYEIRTVGIMAGITSENLDVSSSFTMISFRFYQVTRKREFLSELTLSSYWNQHRNLESSLLSLCTSLLTNHQRSYCLLLYIFSRIH